MDADPRHYENIAINEKDILDIILSYLIHNCYKESAEAFITCTGMKVPADYLENTEKRKRIVHYALEGNALKAIELTEHLTRDILMSNRDVLFDLLCLHFIELVCSKKCAEALDFVQTNLIDFWRDLKYILKLQEFMALLSYNDPIKSPMFNLLSMVYRQQVAYQLNRTVLAFFDLPRRTAMKRLIQQATVVRQCLKLEGGPPQFSLKDFLKS